MMTNLDAALEYLDRGWSIIPLNPNDKKPFVKWAEFQKVQPTEEQIVGWWTQWPDAIPAVITGRLSGVYIVDCDSDDAFASAVTLGLHRTPIRTRTRRGVHLWYAPPGDSIHRGPRVGSRGSTDPNFHWPQISGLDWRGDGGYAALPYPNGPYRFDLATGSTWDDLPVWTDLRPTGGTSRSTPLFDSPAEDLADINLSGCTVIDPRTEWERTAEDVANLGRKIPTGQSMGRNERVMRTVSDAILAGVWGEQSLARHAVAFMDEFFLDRLPEREFMATIRSMMQAERRNHPERFDANGNVIPTRTEQVQSNTNQMKPADTGVTSQTQATTPPAKPFVFIKASDADRLLAEATARGELISPLLPAGGTVAQVFGFSGHGKSTFVQHLLFAAAAGQKEWGPFDIQRPIRTLYLDWENGGRTIADRLKQATKLYGDPGDNFLTWAPFADDAGPMNLHEDGNLTRMAALIQQARPEVVVIDTIRSAWPGLMENDANAWAPVNQLALKLRNYGLTVIKIHHSTKPSGKGAEKVQGHSSGSTHQLTNLEVQMGVTQVYADEARATAFSGIFAGNLEPRLYGIDEDGNIFDIMTRHAGSDWVLEMMMELRFTKLRERTPEHEDAYLVALAMNVFTGEKKWVSTWNIRKRARFYVQAGFSVMSVAQRLRRSVEDIKRWTQ